MRVAALMMGIAIAAIVQAQTSRVVTASNPANLQDTIDLASAGDEVAVLPGSYPSMSLTKGLTIRAQQPGTVFLQTIYAFERDRETLVNWADQKGEAGVAKYWQDKNAASIDGLSGI